MNELSAVFSKLPTALITFVLGIGALLIGKLFYFLANPSRKESKNVSSTISFCGFLASLGIALNCGVAITGDQWSIEGVVIGAVVSILLLKISMLTNDRLIMYGIDNNEEILRDNFAVTIVETSGLLATGFMLRGVLMSNSASFLDKFIDIGAYWVIGQVLFVLGAAIYKLSNINFGLGHGFGTTDDLQKNNVPIALSFGGFLIAYGMIIEASLTGATSNIFGELPSIIVFSVVGLVLMILVDCSVKFIASESLTSVSKKTEKVGVGLIVASVLISLGFIFSGVIDSSITKNEQFETDQSTVYTK